ncbi:hypothetical protein ABPG75_005600 [Micractinium tetrahymenae]
MARLLPVALLLLVAAVCAAQSNQAESLLAQKAAITNWAAFSFAAGLVGWDDRTPVCNWTGVECNAAGDVSSLNMSCTPDQPRFCAMRAQGQLVPDLCQLSSITSIKFANHSLSGPLPAEWGGPDACQSLSFLYLNDNKLSGTIPASFGARGSMPNLPVASLGTNSFNGRCPTP